LPLYNEAGRLGRLYLARFPEEADPRGLVRAVLDALGPLPPHPVPNLGADFTHRLAAGMGSDFARGRLVEVDGWLLAITEARLYALLSLG
jgi:hypothetical protein